MQLAHYDFFILFQYTNKGFDDLYQSVAKCFHFLRVKYDVIEIILYFPFVNEILSGDVEKLSSWITHDFVIGNIPGWLPDEMEGLTKFDGTLFVMDKILVDTIYLVIPLSWSLLARICDISIAFDPLLKRWTSCISFAITSKHWNDLYECLLFKWFLIGDDVLTNALFWLSISSWIKVW